MVNQIRLFLPISALGVLLLGIGACTQSLSEGTAVQLTEQRRANIAPDTSGYERRAPQDMNGIGKYYMGRQIAHVMGHEGASWLDRSDRAREEDTDQLLRALKLKPSDVVADIGAGTGYFTFKMSPLVPQGKVLAVDIQPEMLASLRATTAKLGANNVIPVRGTTQNPNLPAGQVDLVLLVDAYHEFDYPREMGRAIRQALSPDGRLALVEYRAEDPNVPIKRIHKMSVAQARREMAAIGLRLTDSVETLPQQHLLFFQK
ncbi:class I SAM-dependent methyltransferase [Hymenobacter terrestris]|uniref:Class I SAM-dependent methyltransferase n=1 Tax=Hymenobacter terrestris TaxID=2748310 RepID=A0ABX2PYY1_9BACT|nr:class I SAM-dependent methyltransferase [Hymenobacter terrestris]NVO83898.1 class I SAM-dependent methyltransferase [Hymenobacter terrestris]